MKTKLLFLFSYALCLQYAFGQGNYLLPRFQDEVVNMRVHSSSLYWDHTPSTTNPFIGQNNAATNWNNQQWEIVSTDQATWYRIRHVNSGKYLTMPDNRYEGAYLEMRDLGYGNDPGNSQLFQFVLQNCTNCTDMYKIHTKYAAGGGYDYMVQLPIGDNNIGTQVRMGKNITVGNDDHQEFTLALLYPDDNPSGSPGNLANRFENRTSGFTAVFNGWELLGSTNHNRLYEQSPTPGITADEEWKIEYSNETGWFRIRNKLQNKYITVTGVDGETVLLQSSYSNSDPRQKFKFVQQIEGDDTYKIFTRYSVGSPGRALVLNVPTTDTVDITLAKNKQTNGYNQKIKLTRDLPLPAIFTSGTPTIGGGKILNRQYHISNSESFALLEPYVVGTDTFVRVQPAPVYGENSEWTLNAGVAVSDLYQGFAGLDQTVRIRYGKTGQYLYMPLNNVGLTSIPHALLQLKSDTSSNQDKHFHFWIKNDGATNNNWSFNIESLAGFNNSQPHRMLEINDDGYLQSKDENDADTYVQNRKFFINLTIPNNNNKTYTIVSRSQGHFVTDSGIDVDAQRIVHSLQASNATSWYFESTGDGYYKIKNLLTKNYIVASYGNNGGVGTELKTTQYDGSTDTWRWALEPSGNFFKIRNKFTGKYMAVYFSPNPGNPVYNALSSDPGTEWIVGRSDFLTDPLLDNFNSETLLQNYAPLSLNAYNWESVRNKLVKNIGLPFEPSYAYPLADTATQRKTFELTGIPFTPTAPSFYTVIRSALAWKFNWNTARVDSAMKNYKFNIPGHRVQVAYALRSYIVENLAVRTNRTSWTYDEKELVAYIERTIKSLKKGYANRVETNWNEVKDATAYQNSLYFNSIMGLIPDPDNYEEPDYYRPDSVQSASLVEYQVICSSKNYKNPYTLASVIAPSVSIAGAGIITSIALNLSLKSALGISTFTKTALYAAAFTIKEGVTEGAKVLAGAVLRTGVLPLISAVASSGALTGMISIVITCVQGLVQYGQDGTAYTNFDNFITSKVAALRNTPVDVMVTMKGANLLNQLYMCQDVDFILATGERFDLPGIPNVATFNGNGNWSDPANWSNNAVPPNPLLTLNPTISVPDSIMINPITGGKCIIDIDLDASPLGQLPPPPIHVMAGKTLQIKAGVTFKVEDLYIRKP